MCRSLKTLLLYLLLLALPVQGMAAAGRLSCSSEHQGMAPLAAVAERQVQAAHHSHDAHTADVGHADHVDHAQTGHQQGQTDQSSCSACAACCIGAAVLPSISIGVKPVAVSFAPPAAPARFLASHFPAGPERPPRISA